MRPSNVFLFITLLLFSLACSKEGKESDSSSVHGSKNESYYTCSMHPQVHEHGPGSCPICGMPLIKFSANQEAGDEKKHLLPSSYQKAVLNFTTYTTKKSSIIFKLPSSGRILNRQEVAFYIYEVDLPFIKAGLTFEGMTASGKKVSGIISSVDRIADPSSRAIRVIGKATGSEPFSITEGSFFGSIHSKPLEALMVPDDAVLRTGKKNIAYVVGDEGEIRPQEVQLGRSQGDSIEILDGLEEGMTIVAGPNFLLDSEARLRGFDD